jgi:hypothetical protein
VGSIPLYFGTTMASEIVNAECFINALVLSASPLHCAVSLNVRVVDGFGRRSTASSLGARWQAWTTQHCRSGAAEMPVTVAAVVLQ